MRARQRGRAHLQDVRDKQEIKRHEGKELELEPYDPAVNIDEEMRRYDEESEAMRGLCGKSGEPRRVLEQDAPQVPIEEAAAAAGVSESQLRALCGEWPSRPRTELARLLHRAGGKNEILDSMLEEKRDENGDEVMDEIDGLHNLIQRRYQTRLDLLNVVPPAGTRAVVRRAFNSSGSLVNSADPELKKRAVLAQVRALRAGPAF